MAIYGLESLGTFPMGEEMFSNESLKNNLTLGIRAEEQ